MANFQKGDKKIINAWAMYDWANSVYSLVITVAVFPIYYNAITTTKDDAGNVTSDLVSFFGMEFINTELLSYVISASFFMMVILSPILSAIADYTGRQKFFMRMFCYIGSFACMFLFFFTPDTFEAGMIAFFMASVGFTGSIVFYNSYLPIIAEPEDHDRISAKGFSLGYIGSVILLVFNLVMIQKPDLFGITDPSLPARISFLSVGIWWFAFAHIPLHYLPSNVFKKEAKGNILFKGYEELGKVFRQVKGLPRLRNFIFAFFFYSMGVQTVIYLASSYGTKELGIETTFLIISILAIQLVAIVGALFFSRSSAKIGNIPSLMLACTIWGVICIVGYFVSNQWQFLGMAAAVGFVMGGIQALSRSTYAKMLPKTEDTATFFSFYDITEKLATSSGTLVFGYLIFLTGSMRASILPLVIFFIIGLVFLTLVKRIIAKETIRGM